VADRNFTQGPPAGMPDEEASKLIAFYSVLNDLLGGHLDPNPFDVGHDYNYPDLVRSGYGTQSDLDRLAVSHHWPSEFKQPQHPNRFIPISNLGPEAQGLGGFWDTHNEQSTFQNPNARDPLMALLSALLSQ
jgi:hypothetical protein